MWRWVSFGQSQWQPKVKGFWTISFLFCSHGCCKTLGKIYGKAQDSLSLGGFSQDCSSEFWWIHWSSLPTSPFSHSFLPLTLSVPTSPRLKGLAKWETFTSVLKWVHLETLAERGADQNSHRELKKGRSVEERRKRETCTGWNTFAMSTN